jgi:hypothetical protein
VSVKTVSLCECEGRVQDAGPHCHYSKDPAPPYSCAVSPAGDGGSATQTVDTQGSPAQADTMML